MQALFRRRPSPSMIVACIALLVALGGTSVAAVQALAPNSVGTAQLKANAVTTGKVRNGSLVRADFAARSIPVGPRGPAGVIGAIAVRQASVVVPGGTAQNSAYDTETVSVNCNANEKAISAGSGWSDDASDRELWTQRLTPVLTGANVTGFRATGGNDSGNTSTFTLYVLCYVG